MNQHEKPYTHLIEDLPVDVSGHWTEWDWDQMSSWASLRHCDDSRFLGAGILLLRATKGVLE